MAKYRVRRNGWDISRPSYRLYGIWRGIIADKALFAGNIRYKIGLGEDVFFWLDVWVGVRPLAADFSSLFRCASNQSTKAKDYMEKINDHTVWTPIFKRVLQEDEERELIHLLGVLDQVFVPKEGPDHRIWITSKGVFTFHYPPFRQCSTLLRLSVFDSLWKSKVPPRVLGFAWLVLRG